MQHHRTTKRLLSALLVLCIALILIPLISLPVQAALTDTNIGVAVSSGAANSSINGNTVSADATGSWNANANYTITLTNNSGAEATLSFVYTVTNSGRNSTAPTVQYYTASSSTATTVSLASGDTFKQTLQAGGRVVISVTTAKLGKVAVNLTDISLRIKTTTNVTFKPDSTVSYTVGYVDGNAATQTATVTAGAAANVTVEAELSEGISITPATTDYTCESATGTVSGTVYIDKNSEFIFGKNDVITPIFYSSSGTKPFYHKENETYFWTFGAAMNAGSGTVILTTGYTLPAGNYTIPYGVNFLIPYNSANLFRGVPTEYSFKDMSLTASSPPASPEVSIIDYAKRTSTADTEYRRLTMASGANIVVEGALEVSGQTDSYGRGQRGAYSVIQMEANTSITVNGTLYAWGYIRGSGTVTVNGTVYEHFDVLDYPHAGAGGMDTLNTAGVFGMRDYSFNSVEVEATYSVGASLKAYICITGTNIGTNAFIRTFIGSTSDAVVQLTSGTIKKTYVNDRQKLEVSGAVNVNSISISMTFAIIDYKMDSAATSGLPFARNWDVICTSGGTVTLNNSVLLYAGATVTVDQGAKIIVPAGKNIYIMDYVSDPVDNDTKNIDNMTISVSGDALVDINGEVQVTSGDFTLGETTCKSGLYTTYSGTSYPSITSSKGTGKITITGSVGTATTVPVRQGYYNYSADVKCNITPAKLCNSDNSIVETANGGANTYTYVDGYWRCGTHSFEGGVCTVCGIHLFTIEASQIYLGNNLDMAFRFVYNGAETDDLSGYTVKLTHTGAEDVKVADVTYSFSDWTQGQDDNGTSYYFVVYKGLTARRMCDTITLAVYLCNTPVSDSYNDSMQNYATRQLEKYEQVITSADATEADKEKAQLLLTVLVDILNYGAEAQVHFEYNPTNLANAGLTETQKAYATANLKNTSVPESNLNFEGSNWLKSNLVTTSNIQFLMAIEGLSLNSTVTVTFTNHRGDSKEITSPVIGKAGDYYYVTIDKLVVADAWCLVTVTVDGVEYTDSIVSYLDRYEGESAVYDAYWKFADSAYAYFHPDK